MKSIFYFVVLFLTIVSCSTQNKERSVSTEGLNPSNIINVSNVIDKDPDCYLEDLIYEIKIIPLETTEKSVISTIKNAIITSNFIYVLDISERGTLKIFDTNGKFIKNISKGPGPEEIGAPLNIYFDKKTNYLFVYDGINHKISKFTAAGDYITSYYMEGRLYANDFFVYDNKLGIIQIGNPQFNIDYRVVITDTLFNEQTVWTLGKEYFNIGFWYYVQPCDDGVNIMKHLDNTLYCYKNGIIERKYLFEEHRPNITNDKYQDYLNSFSSSDYVNVGNNFESKDYLWTYFSTGTSSGKTVIINKNGAKKMFKYKENTLPCYMDIQGVAEYETNYFWANIEPEIFKGDQFPWSGSNPNNLISPEDMEKLKKVQPDDNPIIVLFKLKDEI